MTAPAARRSPLAFSPPICGPLSALTTTAAALALSARLYICPSPPSAPPRPAPDAPSAQRGPAKRPRSTHNVALHVRPPPWARGGDEARDDLWNVAWEAWDVFEDRYVDEPGLDWVRLRERYGKRTIRTSRELTAAVEWLLSHAGDRFTRYLSVGELDSMKDDIVGEMCGVGIVFDVEAVKWRRAKRVVVKEVVRNSPAADAGLARGDEITAIDLTSIRRMSVDEATDRLLGEEGKKVSLSFVRCADDLELSVTLTRRRFSVPTVSSEAVVVSGVGRVGYIQVREFAASTALQARRSVRKLLRSGVVDVFVLDFRGNAGGLVDQAVELAKVFLRREDVIVRFVGRGNAETLERSHSWWLYRQRVRVTAQPIIVLVDEATASASELVAAALRDNCRAVIVGSPTYGKGSVQAIAQLSDGSGMAVTVARYRTPRNRGIELGRGLRPDIFRSNLAVDSEAVKQLLGRPTGWRATLVSTRGGRSAWIRAKIAVCSARRRG